MIVISHRGNINGSLPEKENRPSYIDSAIQLGYEVEVDIRYLNGKFYLGHDTPDYEISEIWMEKRKDKIWFHCKNLDASFRLYEMQTDKIKYRYFCHSFDTYVLTSTGNVWVHDLSLNINDKCIIPLLNNDDIIEYSGNSVYAVCTDYVLLANFKLK